MAASFYLPLSHVSLSLEGQRGVLGKTAGSGGGLHAGLGFMTEWLCDLKEVSSLL